VGYGTGMLTVGLKENMSSAGARDLRVVAIGGGTGLSTLLRGFRKRTSHTTAVVTVTDDGGSSGRLREELGVLPPGDVRNCLVALADDESLMGALFSHRFTTGSLEGHSLGNLFLAALTQILGDFDKAVRESSKVLAIRGTVLPSTTHDVRLHSHLQDGTYVQGETSISASAGAVSRVWLEPADCRALPLALERIAEADVVVLGPGSLYTSVIPNLLVGGVREALVNSSASVIYVANVMTQPGETPGYSAGDHLDALIRHVGEGVVDAMLVNSSPIPSDLLHRYADLGAEPVLWLGTGTDYRGVRIVEGPISEVDGQVRHNPDELVAWVVRMGGVAG